MRIVYKIMILIVLLIGGRALSQTAQSSMFQSGVNDSVCNFKTAHDSNGVSCNDLETVILQADLNAEANSVLSDGTKPDWNLCSFIATVVGIVAALGTLFWMIRDSNRENENFLNQLGELKKQNQRADKQLQNQEKELRDASERSRKLNAALKESVEDIKDYLTKKDLVIKLKEKKDVVYGTFVSLWNSSLTKLAANVKDGSIINNQAVMNGIVSITSGITTFKDLIPNISDSCEEACRLCVEDMAQLSKKKKKGDISEWLKGMKKHFEDLEKEMSSCIDNLLK